MNLLAALEEGFPMDHLRTLFYLSSPISGHSPQPFNEDVSEVVNKIAQKLINSGVNNEKLEHLRSQVLHVSIQSGSRDSLVRVEHSIPNQGFGFKYFLFMETLSMRNIYTTVDHNAQLFNKRFLDGLIPTLTALMVSHESATSERHALGDDLIRFSTDKVLMRQGQSKVNFFMFNNVTSVFTFPSRTHALIETGED